MIDNSIDSLCRSLVLKCTECGIPPESFIKEKILELEERKRIVLTPSRYWFRDNYSRYNEFASLALSTVWLVLLSDASIQSPARI